MDMFDKDVTNKDRERLKKQPQWVQELVQNLERQMIEAREQVRQFGGVPEEEARKKSLSYISTFHGSMNNDNHVVVIEPGDRINLALGKRREKLNIYIAEDDGKLHVRVYGDDRIRILPQSTSSFHIEMED